MAIQKKRDADERHSDFQNPEFEEKEAIS